MVEAALDGVGDRGGVAGRSHPLEVGDPRAEALDRVAEGQEQPGLGCSTAEQPRHPRKGEVVGGPLAGDRPRPSREPSVVPIDVGGSERCSAEAVEEVPLLVDPHVG